MADATDIATTDAVTDSPKRGAKGLIFGILGAVILGGGAFYSIYSGLIDPAGMMSGGGHESAAAPSGHDGAATAGPLGFVPMDPITISLPPGSSARHLRFTGQLEVDPAQSAEVVEVMPRVLDVLNTYLRAVEVRDLEQPSAIPRLRAQMLRRVQVVTGEGRVRDLLITEFILN